MDSTRKNRAQAISSALLTLSAVAIAITVVYRGFFSETRGPSETDRRPQRVGHWDAIIRTGIHVGNANATVRVAEFSDLECPACKLFHTRFREAQKKYGTDVSLVFVHYPLGRHRFAKPAARAAECAEREGRFAAFVDAIYDAQDSLGLKSWTDYARTAGVANIERFSRCVTDSKAVPRIEEGIAVGDTIGVRATPTIVINGWRLSGIPSERELDRVIEAIRHGGEP